MVKKIRTAGVGHSMAALVCGVFLLHNSAQASAQKAASCCNSEWPGVTKPVASVTPQEKAGASMEAFTHVPEYKWDDLDDSSVEGKGQAVPSTTRTTVTQKPLPENGTVVERRVQTKRILGIIPNFRAVSADEKLPPQTPKEKFITTTQDSFDYSSAVIPVLLAGYSMATRATPEFHQGVAGYGQYLWHAALDQTTENYFVEFAFPVITHEDSRYYTLGHGRFVKRASYAVSRALITRSDDSGKDVFNISEVAGAGASAGLSMAYYPAAERSFVNAGTTWGLDIGIDALTFVLKEFWPDINHSLFHYGQPR